MIDVTSHRAALEGRLDVVTRLIRETHPTAPGVGQISREARGLAVVLIFAAYEELLRSLTRNLLEVASGLRVSNKRLRPGFQAFAIYDSAKSIRAVSEKKLFRESLPRLLELTNRGGRESSINVDLFPSDGSFMRRSQIEVWCTIFEIGSPATLLPNVWNSIDTVVTQRNAVAHGRETPQEIGKYYTEAEIVDLVSDWGRDWDSFLVHVGKLASSRDFYRVPR